jgi:ketosteroid isomerase-like protein
LLDPESVLASWTLENQLTAGGTYSNAGLSMFRLRDGLVSEYIEYYDPAAFVAAFGPAAAQHDVETRGA